MWAFFCLPELKVCLIRLYLSVHHWLNFQGRSLEELDELFNVKPRLPAWRFANYYTTGPDQRVREIEGRQEISGKPESELIEAFGEEAMP